MLSKFETKIRVRYSETDAMGIVHHSRYLVWLEVARIEWLRLINLDYKQLEANGYFIPVVALNINYLLPACFDDVITVFLSVDTANVRARFKLNYELICCDKVIATASSTHAFIDANKKLIRPPEIFLNAMLSHSTNV